MKTMAPVRRGPTYLFVNIEARKREIVISVLPDIETESME